MNSPDACYFLGPSGTFTELAAQQVLPEARSFKPVKDIAAVIASVEAAPTSVGVVPVENSIHGEVTATLDLLAFGDHSVLVVGETSVPVTFVAYATAEGSQDKKFTAALSHPHALAQCSRFIADWYLTKEETNSTADACRVVAQDERHDALAIAAPGAGEKYGLTAVHSEIEDHLGALTRFLALGKRPAPPGEHNRTMLLVVPRENRPGALLQSLRAFGERDINVSSLYARPLRSELGTYGFLITLDTHLAEASLRAALHEILSAGHSLRVIGSFPSDHGLRPQAPYRLITGLVNREADLTQLIARFAKA